MDLTNLLGDFVAPPILKCETPSDDKSLSNVTLLEMNLSTDHDLLRDFMPSRLIQEGNFNFTSSETFNNQSTAKDSNDIPKKVKATEKTEAQVSWLSLFKELDPLANQDDGNFNNSDAGDRA